VVLALAFGSTFASQLMTAYADVPLALVAVTGVLCLGLWLRELDWRYLALACLLLGAAANVKNEGLLLVVAAFVAAALVLAVGRVWKPLARLGLGFLALVLVALAPWHIWIAAKDIKSNLPISKGLDPGYLSDRSDRIVPSFKALYPLLESGGLLYVVPLALALVLLALATAGLRRVAAFYLLAGVGTLASVIWAFVITTDTLAYQISTSASRVIMGVTAVSLAALLHLGGLLDGEASETSDRLDHAAQPLGRGLDPLARPDARLPAE
jgi:4-amino-4-deoxy-L-arabinose transferase-like glycosyltransferase